MTDLLLIAFIFLLAGVFVVPLAKRAGLGTVLGYLIAGVLISPLLRLLGVDVIAVQHIAEFGVVMMLFLIGLELQPAQLWALRHRLLGLGGGQIILTLLLLSLAGWALGLDARAALAVGMLLSLSSTAIVLQTLGEQGSLRSDGGQASFAVLLAQDVAVIPMLALLPLLALYNSPGLPLEVGFVGDPGGGHGGGQGGATGLSLVAGLAGWQVTLVTLGTVALIVLIGSYLVRPLLRFIAATGVRELLTAAALLLVVAVALAMLLVGLSPALGAFLAGVVLAGSEYRHELETDIEPFRGLLLGLFFTTVGAAINFTLLFDQFGQIIALTLGLILVKMAVLLVMGRLFSLRAGNLLLFAFGLAQAGEFAFVLIAAGLAERLLPQALADRLQLIVALSLLLTPLLFLLARRLTRRFVAAPLGSGNEASPQAGKIIIAGMGRFGGVIYRLLTAAGENPTVIDYSAAQLKTVRAFGLQAYYGDATRSDLLRAAGIEDASLLVLAIDNKEATTALVRSLTARYPHLHIIARAHDRHHVYELYRAGCRDIIRETFDSSVRAGRSALEALGWSPDLANQMAEGFVRDDQTSMIALAALYDPDLPNPENKAYVALARQLRETQLALSREGPSGFGRLRERLEQDSGLDFATQIARFREESRQRHAAPRLARQQPRDEAKAS